MPLLIKIADEVIERREIRGKSGSFTVESQYGVADLPNGERRKVRIRVPRDAAPYRPGLYRVSDESFSVGQWGDLEIGQLHLVPAAAPAATGAPGGVSAAPALSRS